MNNVLFRALPASLLLLTGCANLPRDARNSTEAIRQSRVLRVGVSHQDDVPRPVREAERRMVALIAQRLGARVQWQAGNAHALLEDLEDGKLALAAVGLPNDTPFAGQIGVSKPYLPDGPNGKSYSLAVAPGENRLLLLVDQTIETEKEGTAN